MLKDKVKTYIESQLAAGKKENIELYQEEMEYALKNGIFSSEQLAGVIKKDPFSRFQTAHLERCDKATEETVAKMDSRCLSEKINFLKKNRREFVYMESEWFDMLGIDAVSLELDDVFGTYDVMLGIDLKKEDEAKIKEFLDTHLNGEEVKFDLLYSNEEKIWNLNFTLNYMDQFHEEMTFGEAYVSIYRLLFELVAAVENDRN